MSLRGIGVRVLAALVVLALAVGLSGGADAVALTAEPSTSPARAYLVLVDGQVQQSRNAGARLPPASLTKLMTALLAVEHDRRGAAVVTVSARAAAATGSRLGLRAGEQLSAGDLLAAVLLASANDACRALAEAVAGDEARFVAAMNRRARELGLPDTRFANACGHDAPGHYSSARDLARLAEVALREPQIAELVAQVELAVATVGGRRLRLVNHNELVGRYPGAVGVKSGYTPKAGKCVVALARRGGVQVLLVLLDAPNRWWDAEALLDQAFAGARSGRNPAQ